MLQCAQRLPGMPGRSPVSGESPTCAVCVFFFGGKRFFASVGLRSVAFGARRERKIDRLRRSALRADPETRSRFVAFLGFGKSDGCVSLGRRARRRGRGNAGTASVAVSRGGRRGTDRESHAPWPCSERAREPTSRLVRVTHRHAGSRDREAFGPCVSGRASNVGRVCQRRKEIARSNRVGSGPRRVERGSFRGFERARTCLAEPIRYRDLVAGKPSRARARTSRPNLAWRVASAFRFAAHFLVAEPSVGKTERRGGEKVGQTSGRATEPTVCGPSRRAEGEFLAESRRAGTRRSRAAGVSATTSPNPSRAAPRTTRGGAFRGKPARASVKNSPSPRVSGRRERAHRGGCGRGKPREARLRSAHECEAPTRPTRRAKTPPRAALARLRRERERAAMAKPERREYCRTRAHLRKTAFQSRRVVPYPETTSLTPARPLRASISPSSARATDPRPCHRRR